MIGLMMLAAALGQSGDGDDHQPIWDQFPALICRANAMVFCDDNQMCRKESPSAVFLIDFKAGTMKATMSKKPSHILFKESYPGLGDDNVVTDNHGSMSFGKVTFTKFNAPSVKATLAEPSASFSPTIMWMTCNPM